MVRSWCPVKKATQSRYSDRSTLSKTAAAVLEAVLQYFLRLPQTQRDVLRVSCLYVMIALCALAGILRWRTLRVRRNSTAV